MQRQLESENGDASPMTKQQLEEMAKQLARKDGVDQLRKQLKELAKPEPSDDAQREKGLGDAERGGADAQRGLGGVPIPMDADGAPAGSPGDKPNSGSGPANGSPGPGSKHDSGTGNLGEAQKTEVGAVDHADIPEEYREQVGRYFEP